MQYTISCRQYSWLDYIYWPIWRPNMIQYLFFIIKSINHTNISKYHASSTDAIFESKPLGLEGAISKLNFSQSIISNEYLSQRKHITKACRIRSRICVFPYKGCILSYMAYTIRMTSSNTLLKYLINLIFSFSSLIGREYLWSSVDSV